MYTFVGTGTKFVPQRPIHDEAPGTVDFELGPGYIVAINVSFFQRLRRGTDLMPSGHCTDLNPNGENKISLIKDVRTIYSLGLKEAKDIVEWFLANFERHAQ